MKKRVNVQLHCSKSIPVAFGVRRAQHMTTRLVHDQTDTLRGRRRDVWSKRVYTNATYIGGILSSEICPFRGAVTYDKKIRFYITTRD